jgi:hypothetical protein
MGFSPASDPPAAFSGEGTAPGGADDLDQGSSAYRFSTPVRTPASTTSLSGKSELGPDPEFSYESLGSGNWKTLIRPCCFVVLFSSTPPRPVSLYELRDPQPFVAAACKAYSDDLANLDETEATHRFSATSVLCSKTFSARRDLTSPHCHICRPRKEIAFPVQGVPHKLLSGNPSALSSHAGKRSHCLPLGPGSMCCCPSRDRPDSRVSTGWLSLGFDSLPEQDHQEGLSVD